MPWSFFVLLTPFVFVSFFSCCSVVLTKTLLSLNWFVTLSKHWCPFIIYDLPTELKQPFVLGNLHHPMISLEWLKVFFATCKFWSCFFFFITFICVCVCIYICTYTVYIVSTRPSGRTGSAPYLQARELPASSLPRRASHGTGYTTKLFYIAGSIKSIGHIGNSGSLSAQFGKGCAVFTQIRSWWATVERHLLYLRAEAINQTDKKYKIKPSVYWFNILFNKSLDDNNIFDIIRS